MLKNASTLTLLAACVSSHAATPDIDVLPGEYNLTSSTTAPVGNWIYSKAHISVRKLDDRHLVILFACEWKRQPKAACDDYYFAQWRNDGLYLQDMNTDALRINFDPATRALTMISRAVDAKASVRRDLFAPVSSAPEDAALARRLKRSEKNYVHPESLRVFGPYNKWKYETNRIEFQNVRP